MCLDACAQSDILPKSNPREHEREHVEGPSMKANTSRWLSMMAPLNAPLYKNTNHGGTGISTRAGSASLRLGSPKGPKRSAHTLCGTVDREGGSWNSGQAPR